ncbi:MAG TPA: 16S rRNA (adenine(1518)-N(6)/adenine(1519)-N(6))-dimethyltransferase RsmA [Candidatus Saccharimonadales bacterium]|nr:16S rRNA (adenine(1518)-N(6)/adenine(1519)-N(6))-dimethyltransferase RsmA [Candidatus Saccharimonadales bacterium]
MKPAEILRSLEKTARKRFGQNFLVNPKVAEEMITAAELKNTDTVVEIGPGLGALTEELIKKAGRVIAIELDRDLAEYLRNRRLPQVTVVTGNSLDIDWTVTIGNDYKIVANIPYSITSPVLRKIFQLENRPSVAILLIQKEMAERIVAPAGSSERGFLTLLTEANAEVKIVGKVKPGSFHPMPKVDSAIIKVTPSERKMETILWPAVEAAFRHKRQTLVNALTKDLPLKRSELEKFLKKNAWNPLIRPSELTFADWQTLSKEIKNQLD